MKNSIWFLFIFAFLFLAGCANVTEEADKTYIDTNKIPLMFYSIDKEAEKMLYEAMYSSPIKWEEHDLEKVLTARGTLKMAGDYLDQKEKLEGGITFFTLREFLGFTTYAFEQYEQGADGRAEQCGTWEATDGLFYDGCVLTEQEDWIYRRVKSDVWTNLKSLRAYIDIVANDINDSVNEQTLERFKQAYSIVENIIPIKLPDNLDF